MHVLLIQCKNTEDVGPFTAESEVTVSKEGNTVLGKIATSPVYVPDPPDPTISGIFNITPYKPEPKPEGEG